MRVPGSRATSRTPSRTLGRDATTSASIAAGSGASTIPTTGAQLVGSHATRAVATSSATIAVPNTSAGVPTARIAAAARGPSSIPKPSIVPDRPFAAVSSSGVRERLGKRAPWVGRVNPSVAAAAAATPTTSAGEAMDHIAAQVRPNVTTCAR